MWREITSDSSELQGKWTANPNRFKGKWTYTAPYHETRFKGKNVFQGEWQVAKPYNFISLIFPPFEGKWCGQNASGEECEFVGVWIDGNHIRGTRKWLKSGVIKTGTWRPKTEKEPEIHLTGTYALDDGTQMSIDEKTIAVCTFVTPSHLH